MKKEFYKLSLVFVMIIFSFSLAFFLGREVTLFGQKQEKEASPVQQAEQLNDESIYVKPSSKEVETQTQTEKVNEYEQSLLRTEVKEDTKNEKKIDEIKEDVKSEEEKEAVKPSNILYGLLINSYSERELATEKAAQLKLRFPNWKFFFKKSKNLYKVYIGPFTQKEAAENFLKEIKKKPDFSSVKVEQI